MKLRKYELLIIFDGDMKEEESANLLEWLKNEISVFGGNVEDVEERGRTELSYPIKKKNMGYMYILKFVMSPDKVNSFRHELDLKETILRYFLTVLEEVKEG